jgi:hypothetical protein
MIALLNKSFYFISWLGPMPPDYLNINRKSTLAHSPEILEQMGVHRIIYTHFL